MVHLELGNNSIIILIIIYIVISKYNQEEFKNHNDYDEDSDYESEEGNEGGEYVVNDEDTISKKLELFYL